MLCYVMLCYVMFVLVFFLADLAGLNKNTAHKYWPC